MSAQASLFDQAPPVDTRAAARERIAPRARQLRDRALETIERSNGLTADQVAARLGESILAIRPRITELKVDRLIRDTGERRKNASGASAKVWMAIDPARSKGNRRG